LRAMKTDDQFEKDAFANTGRAEQDACLSRRDRERDVRENGRAIEGDSDIAQRDDRARAGGRSREGRRKGGGIAHVGKTKSSKCVMTKSTAMMSTEELTTAEIVERPTPSVPPVVRIP